MTAIAAKSVEARSLSFCVDLAGAGAGTGEIVILLHRFVQTWHAWRAERDAPEATGYRA